MKKWGEISQNVCTVHSSIAEKLVGGIIECAVCRGCTTPTTSVISSYLAKGWPVCCGSQMSWVSKKELKGRKSGNVRQEHDRQRR